MMKFCMVIVLCTLFSAFCLLRAQSDVLIGADQYSYLFEPDDTHVAIFPILEGTVENNNPEFVFDQVFPSAWNHIYDDAYAPTIEKERVPLKTKHIREADVAWQKRIWREINANEKFNMHFIYKHQSFMEVLLTIIQNHPNEKIAFRDEAFTEPIPYNEIVNRLNSIDTIAVLDADSYQYDNVVVENDIDYASFTRFRVKEDWIMDTRYSRLTPVILGIGPVQDIFDQHDNFRGQELLFWVHYPTVRVLLAKYNAYNPYNDAIQLSWADIFDMRFFHSMITKESNLHDRRIQDYLYGREALWKAEDVKEDLIKYESDLWSF